VIGRRAIAAAGLAVAVACGAAWLATGRAGRGARDEPTRSSEAKDTASTLRGSGRAAKPVLVLRTIVEEASKPGDAGREALREVHRSFAQQAWTLHDLWRLATLGDDSLIAQRVRDAAAERLLAEEDAPALWRLLLAAVRSSEERERRVAAQLLAKRPVTDEALIPELRALFADDAADYQGRKALLASVEKLGARAAPLTQDLIDWTLRIELEREELKRANPFTLYNWDAITIHIHAAIATIGSKALPFILKALEESDRVERPGASIRFELEYAVKNMPPEANPALLALLSSPRLGTRTAALHALLRHDPQTPEAIAAAREALDDPSAEMREAALAGLARGRASESEALVRALSDPSEEVRGAAGDLLKTRPEAVAALAPRVLELLRSEEYKDRLTAAGLLPALGDAGLDAVPDLLRMRSHLLDDSLGRDGGPALAALLALGPKAVPRIVEVAVTARGDLRRAAFDALGRIGGVDDSHLAPLVADLDRLQGPERIDTARALALAGDARAQGVLLDALSSAEEPIRVAAARGLAESKLASPAAVDGLARLEREAAARLHDGGAWHHRHWPAYYAYHRALWRTGSGVPAAMAPLLSDPSGDVRRTAAEALCSAGVDGVAEILRAWPRLDADTRRVLLRTELVAAKEKPHNLRTLALLALADADPAVRLRAAEVFAAVPALETDVVEARIRLLTAPPEPARQAVAALAAAVDRLGPYEDRLRAVTGISDPDVARRVRDLLDVLESARGAAR
jgi:hypothetical protein